MKVGRVGKRRRCMKNSVQIIKRETERKKETETERGKERV